ncbi:AfsR/SARP family transcriptional regulator [Streptomyces abikoensis]|uniref:AfsR/SARP family transcriptional regulator n=1 Tax=Streptomyces abikoensis TaxID=97398 RepID=UPI003674B96C
MLLGPVQASRESSRVELGSPTQRTIFAVLAAQANRVVSRDELMSAVWGENAPATAVNSVYTYIARLRNCLEPDRCRHARSEVLVSDSMGYLLRVAPSGVDTQRFADHLAAARRLRAAGGLHGAVAELRSALRLWQGTPYGGAVGPFVEAERVRLAESHLHTMEDCAELLLELKQPAGPIAELTTLVHRHPLRERPRYLLMRCFAELGRHADAVREYHSLRTTLVEEQGIEPGERLQRLYEQVLRDCSSRSRRRPTTPASSGAPASAEAPASSATSAPHAASVEPMEPVDPAAPVVPAVPAEPLPRVPGPRASTAGRLVWDVPDFTGRDAELAQLNELVTAAQGSEESALLLITGGPGVGKTALATRLAHSLAHKYPHGQLHIDLHAFSSRRGRQAAGTPLRHLIPGMGQPTPPEPLDARSLYRSLVADRRLLIVLDNAESVEQVRALLPGTPASLVIVTSRNGLTGLIARDGARRIVLDGLAEEEATRLFARMVGRPFVARHEAAVRRLVAACGGLPLALRIAATLIRVAPGPDEALDALVEGDLAHSLEISGDGDSSLSTVFGWSYAALRADAAHVFRALGAQSEREVTLPVVAALSGFDAAGCRRALDALVDASLVREVARNRFRLNPLVHSYGRRMAAERAKLVRQSRCPARLPTTVTTITPSMAMERLEMTS